MEKTSEIVEAEDACEPFERFDAEAGFAALDAHQVSGVKCGAARRLTK